MNLAEKFSAFFIVTKNGQTIFLSQQRHEDLKLEGWYTNVSLTKFQKLFLIEITCFECKHSSFYLSSNSKMCLNQNCNTVNPTDRYLYHEETADFTGTQMHLV